MEVKVGTDTSLQIVALSETAAGGLNRKSSVCKIRRCLYAPFVPVRWPLGEIKIAGQM
jgi:hypothetical protein